MAKVTLISQCFVKPKYEVEASKQPYYLGVGDIAFLSAEPIQKGLLFSTKPNNIQSDFVDKLKDSLAFSLVHFYPLAGRLSTKEFPDENKKWVYLDCTKGPGAQLLFATVDYSVSDIVSSVDVHLVVGSFFELGERSINNDGHIRPLLSIQVTELSDGVFIGFTMNHSIVDGTSQWNYINSLSEIFLKLNEYAMKNDIIFISQKPILKPYIMDGWDPILKIPNKDTDRSKLNPDNQITLRERRFQFSSQSIQKLKAKANEECGVNNISSFQALSAFMWQSITRARNLQPELETCCAILMNKRPRLNPPLTNDYFGNYITRGNPMCKVGDLLNKGLGWGAMLINQAIISWDHKSLSKLDETVGRFICGKGPIEKGEGKSPFYSPNVVMIGGSTKFPMYNVEFGFGKPEAGFAGNSGKEDGKINASPGKEGGGSVDFEVYLTHETMEALESDEDFISFVTC